MRELADADRIRGFMRALGREAEADGACYLTGGATAVLAHPGCSGLRRKANLRSRHAEATLGVVEPPISHRDVTTIMGLLGDIRLDVARIHNLLEENDGEEEEAPEDDA